MNAQELLDVALRALSKGDIREIDLPGAVAREIYGQQIPQSNISPTAGVQTEQPNSQQDNGMLDAYVRAANQLQQ